MAATASIIIEVNDAGATAAFQRINAEGAAIGKNLQPIGGISNQAFGQMENSAKRAKESAALVSEELGVRIPRAMRGVIAGMPAISSAMNAAFAGLAVVGFIQIAKSAGDSVVELVERFTGWAETAKKTMEAQTALNQSFVAGNEKIEKMNQAYRLIGLQGVALYSEKQKIANEDLDAAKKKVDDLTASQKKLLQQSLATAAVVVNDPYGYADTEMVPTAAAKDAKAKYEAVTLALASAEEKVRELTPELHNLGKELGDAFSKEKAEGIRDIGVQAQEALKKLQAMSSEALKPGSGTEQAIDANKTALEQQIADLLTFSGDEESVRRAAAAAVQAIEKKASDDRIKIQEDEYTKIEHAKWESDSKTEEETREHYQRLRHIESETETEERNAAIAMAPPWERANAQIVEDYRQRMSRIKEMLTDGEIDEETAGRRMAAAWSTAFGQMRDELANKMESLFDDLTSGNIGQAFLTMFKHLVFQMLATWIMGMQGMRAASQQTMTGSGGGILGSILGSLGMGGIGGGGGSQAGISSLPGVITNLTGESSSNAPMSVIPGIGLSAGAGVAGIGATLPSGASTGTAGGGGLAGLLKSGMLNQLLVTGGAGLLINGAGRGGILGVLESAAGGAMAGFGIGAMFGSAFGPIGMGIGALVGGLIGLFSSLFGEHKGDKARKQVMEPLVAQIKVIQDSYDVFQTDYNSAVTSLETLRADSIAALKKIGGRQVSGNTKGVNADIDAAELHMKTIEAERARRAQIEFGPAQFRSGGYVDSSLAAGMPAGFAAGAMRFAGGGAVPAILHAGEYVLRPSAVRQIGVGPLSAMNSGGGFGGVTLNITTLDAKSFRTWLRDGGMREIAREMNRGTSEGGF